MAVLIGFLMMGAVQAQVVTQVDDVWYVDYGTSINGQCEVWYMEYPATPVDFTFGDVVIPEGSHVIGIVPKIQWRGE